MKTYLHQAWGKQPTGWLDQHAGSPNADSTMTVSFDLGAGGRCSRQWWWMPCERSYLREKKHSFPNGEQERWVLNNLLQQSLPSCFCLWTQSLLGQDEQWVTAWSSSHPHPPLSFSSLVWQWKGSPQDLGAKSCWNCSCVLVLSSQLLCWLLHLGAA